MAPSLTVAGFVRQRAEATPTDIAYRWRALDGQEFALTWRGYLGHARALAEELCDLGVAPGDCVLVLLPDGGEVHVAILAVELVGAVSVGVGWRSGPSEIAHLIDRTSPSAAVSTGEHCRQFSLPTVDFDLSFASNDPASSDPASSDLSADPPIGPTDLWFLNSTSGTTGLPKCVMQNQARWFWFHDRAAEFGALTADEVWMSVVPAPFGFGLWTSHVTPTVLGVPCLTQSRFDAGAAAEMIERHRVSCLSAVSSQFVMILDAAGDRDLTSLRVLFTGGERISESRAKEFEHRTGATILNFYGSNETGMLSGTRIEDPLEKRLTTGGRVVPEMQVRLYGPDGERLAGDVGEGQPACRGPAMSPGYFDDDAANAELFTDDGWMLMGDVVTIDADGWLTVVGRTADFIIRGGKNISAAAVEEEVCTHPDIAHAAAVPVADERLGEKVGIFVELVPAAEPGLLTLADVVTHLEARGVTKNWWPEYLLGVGELPRAPGGKIAKGELRQRAADKPDPGTRSS